MLTGRPLDDLHSDDGSRVLENALASLHRRRSNGTVVLGEGCLQAGIRGLTGDDGVHIGKAGDDIA